MSLALRLMKQLEQRGLSIERGSLPDQLLLCGPAAEKTPEVIAAVKKFKPDLLKLFGPRPEPPPQPAEEKAGDEDDDPEPQPAPVTEPDRCKLCRRDVSNAEDRERLADHLFCSQFGNTELRDKSGNVTLPASPRCPYKPPRK